MGKKAKVAGSIPVPHDGVICFLLNRTEFHDIEESDQPGVSEGLAVLSISANHPSPAERLWTSLTTATQNRDQLQALQTYRNVLLNSDIGSVSPSNAAIFVGTYRTLLELSLSYMTNQPLRRAIRVNIDTLREILGPNTTSVVDRRVLSTIWDEKFWAIRLQTLFEALNYPPLNYLIVQDEQNIQRAFHLLYEMSLVVSPSLDQSSFYSGDPTQCPSTFEGIEAHVDLTTQVATSLKTLLTNLLQQDGFCFTKKMEVVLKDLNLFLWKGITSSAFQVDGLNKLGVAFGQTLYIQWIRNSSKGISDSAKARVHQLIDDNVLPPLNTLCSIQGITSVLPDHVLLHGSPSSLLEDQLVPFLLHQCSQSVQSQTRLMALRTLQTLLNRCTSIVKREICRSDACLANLDKLSHETLHVVMNAWENPPGRQVAGAIPGLFQTLVDFIETLHPGQAKAASGIQRLVGRVITQPVNQKGRYIALETLLPIVGAKTLIDCGGDRLIASLVNGVGDRGHTAGNIACLLGKILSKRREEMIQEGGLVVDETGRISRNQRRKLRQRFANGEEIKVKIARPYLPQEWIDLWAPYFARGLLSKSYVRRKQVSSFCIPLLTAMVGGSSRRADASFALAMLLGYLEDEYGFQKVNGTMLPVLSYDVETIDDIFLWAKLEIARQASAQKLLDLSYPGLRKILNAKFPEELLRSSLTHSSARVRLAAFAALEPVLSTFDSIEPKAVQAFLELDMWRSALPYVLKSTGKEYMSSLLETLTGFLNRLLFVEVEEGSGDAQLLHRFTSFVNDFLLGTIIMKQTAYPGTVVEKEQFGVALLRCLIRVSTRSDLHVIKGPNSEESELSSRSKSRVQKFAMLNSITRTLLLPEMLSMIVSLCHSMWDSTRSEAFVSLVSLIHIAKRNEILLPPFFQDEQAIARGIFLSASPRQREADTGAMILAFVCCVKASVRDQQSFLVWLKSQLRERVSRMRESLNEILTTNDDHKSETVQKGLALPLAHGLIQSVRLIIEANQDDPVGKFSSEIIVEFAEICLQAIQLSLSVVADLKDRESLEAMDDFSVHSGEDTQEFPLNVNTGAIGANATFSSVNLSAEIETLLRFATQRVVIGSWLLTREACATLTSLIVYDAQYVSTSFIGRAGQMLITTMTALKHQGAAFAAQKALQQIATHCMSKHTSPDIHSFPTQWSKRLVTEISSAERVRDSTLRRSTGYALGFLALMRSEVSLKIFPRALCPNIIARLVMLSLPPKSIVEKHASTLGLVGVSQNATLLFSDSLRSHLVGIISFSSENDTGSRVHALNVLRLVILDAPLTQDISPFIGDCIIASIIGYVDDTWAVRNSSTMVFSAAMLRVIDSDKNAVQKDETSSNAISAVEFFRRYVQLKAYLLGVLNRGLNDDQRMEPSFDSLRSPVYLVLLLLARLQPVHRSGDEASSITDGFVVPVIESLSHKEHKIRVIAARALTNISSLDISKASHHESILGVCLDKILNSSNEWNRIHGAIIGIYDILQALPFSCFARNRASQIVWEFCNKHPHIPPSCLAMAIEVRGYCLHGTSVDDDVDELITFCLQLIEEHRQHPTMARAGASTLCHVAGKVATELLCKLLWRQEPRQMKSVEQLKHLFTCDIIDTRLAASKIFKKMIYGHIDDLLLADWPIRIKATLLECVAKIMLDSLTVELRRVSTSASMGAHPPTVRRMSRCLLECLYAMKALGAGELPASNLWHVANSMIPHFDVQSIDRDDKSIGNALEIMGFYFGMSVETDALADKALAFASLAGELANPLGPWRVRHSVACAIDNSLLLMHSRPVIACSLSQRVVLKLLQDSDPDVRFVATSSLAEREKPSSDVALLALERAYEYMGERSGDKSLGVYLLSSLVDRYSGLVMKMEVISEELAKIETSCESTLLNVDTTRKIFEEEDPNSYEEPLLACHLAASVLCSRDLSFDADNRILESCADLEQIGLSILKTLYDVYERYSQTGRPSIMNDVTRQNTLFPDIQGLLVACIVSVFIGGIGFDSLQRQAKEVVSRCGKSSSIHPIILDSLIILATAQPGDQWTRDGLSRICFLVSGELNIRST